MHVPVACEQREALGRLVLVDHGCLWRGRRLRRVGGSVLGHARGVDVVSRLERLRALRNSGSLSAAEFEVLKQQVLREPGSIAAQAPALLAPAAPPPPRRLSPPPPDAYMLPAMAMPRAVPRPPAPQPPYAAVPGPPRGYGVPQLVPRGYDAPPPPRLHRP